MALIAPLRGLRFNPDKITNLDEVVTPPYDVISEEDGAKFLEKNVYNMIQLDLRNNPHGSEEGDESRYQKAKSLFDTWQEEGILIRDEQPSTRRPGHSRRGLRQRPSGPAGLAGRTGLARG